jgi:hypothetical protein
MIEPLDPFDPANEPNRLNDEHELPDVEQARDYLILAGEYVSGPLGDAAGTRAALIGIGRALLAIHADLTAAPATPNRPATPTPNAIKVWLNDIMSALENALDDERSDRQYIAEKTLQRLRTLRKAI